MTSTINFRNSIQAILFTGFVVPALTKGKWAESTPAGHADDWAGAEVKVNPSKTGVNFEPARSMYNLLNKDFVDAVADKALKAVKKETGEDVTLTAVRKELVDMMTIMRSKQGGVPYQFHRGMVGAGKIGRPKNADIPAIEASAAKAPAAGRKSTPKGKTAAKKAPAKKSSAKKAPAAQAA